MRKSITFPALLAATLGLAVACGDDAGGEDTPDSGMSNANCSALTDTYANYAQAYLASNCTTACHGMNAAVLGENVRFDTLAGVKEHKTHIIEHAIELKAPIMPSGSSGLPAAERARLRAWLDCGAP